MRDHPTEMSSFRWVIASFHCYKLFDRGRLAVALGLHHTEFQGIPRHLKFQRRNVRHSAPVLTNGGKQLAWQTPGRYLDTSLIMALYKYVYYCYYFLNLGRSSRGWRQKLILEIITLMVNHPSGSHQQSSREAG